MVHSQIDLTTNITSVSIGDAWLENHARRTVWPLSAAAVSRYAGDQSRVNQRVDNTPAVTLAGGAALVVKIETIP